LGIIAVVFGAVALTKAKLPESPKGMGIAGITLGGIAIFVAVLWLVFVVGSKSVFKNRFENLIEWADEFDNIDSDDTYDEFDDMDSLDDLESALDELEGVADETNGEDIVNDTVIEIDN